VLIVGGAALLVVGAIAVILWPSSEPAKSVQPPRPALAVAPPSAADRLPDRPNRQVRSEPVSVDKVVTSLPVAAVDRTPPPAPQQTVTSQPIATAPPVPQQAAPPPPSPAPANRTTENYGTCVHFALSPAQAAQKATQEQKLLFTVHISGNFEDSHFT
jgi:hypothetical protein